jgi:hypothetical protein
MVIAESEIRGVDEPQHLDRQARIGLDRHGELGGTIGGILGQLQELQGGLRHSGQLPHGQGLFQVDGGESCCGHEFSLGWR